ncbi:hypothetical protein C8R47DRAFT_1113912 [Mycena vitilis]|nr:hypothetical protein C8R47DRAFT_1113912 [Mycena vitilis]
MIPESSQKLPYYAVIFSSKRKAVEGDGYSAMAVKMDALASAQPGFLRMNSVSSVIEDVTAERPWQIRSAITVSYWADEDSIKAWKSNLVHLLAQKKGKEEWYLQYDVQITKVERAYEGGLE